MDRAEAPLPPSHDALFVWETSRPLPERAAGGRSRLRPPEGNRGTAAQRARRAAGQPSKGEQRCTTRSGPRQDAAGHARGPQASEAPVDPWAEARARLRVHLERARRWSAQLVVDPLLSCSDIARREGLSRARVSQVLALVELDPCVLADLEDPGRRGPIPRERALRDISRRPIGEHHRLYLEACEELGAVPTRAKPAPTELRAPRSRDLRPMLERARQYQAWLDGGRHGSLASIARAESMSPTRVGQVLSLLHLHPDIVAYFERVGSDLPAGFRRADLRRIARIRGEMAQRRAFEKRWPGVL